MVKLLNKKFSWFTKETAVRLSYLRSFICSAIAFGLLFAKLIGGNRYFEVGNSFTHAFGTGQNHVVLLIAVMLVMVVLAWSIYELVVVFVPKLSSIVFENDDSSSEISKSYNVVRLIIFIILGLYCAVVFFASRALIVVPILGELDNGILPVVPFLAIFSFLGFFYCGLGDYYLNSNFEDDLEEEKPVKEEKVEVSKEETKKEEPKKEEVKVEPKKEEIKEEIKEEPKKEETKPVTSKKKKIEEEPISEEDQKELADASSLKDSLKAANSKTKKEDALTKNDIVDYLKKKYGNKVELNKRDDYTDTGLPLADTHYVKVGKEKGCFVYVYETKGSVLFLLRIKRELFNKLKSEGAVISRSKFPKAKPSEAWYSLVLDENFNAEKVHEVLDAAYQNISEKLSS